MTFDAAPIESLDAQLDAYAKARPEAPAAPARADDRVRAFDELIAKQFAEDDKPLQTAVDARGATLKGRGELSLRYDMPSATRFFLRHFRIPQRYPHIDFNPPATFCETLEDFIRARLQGQHLSPEIKQIELERLKAEAEKAAQRNGGGTLGVYLSGLGSFINGWLFNYGKAGPPRELLRTPAEQPRILSTTIHEMLGHGFLAEYSALGAEKKAFGVQDWEYAQQFQFRALDTAAEQNLRRKLNLMWNASRYLEEGWSVWVANALTPALLGPPRAPRYTLTQTWEAVERFPITPRSKATFRSILTELFLEPLPGDLAAWLPTIRILQNIAMDYDFAAGLGQPPAYVLGSLMVNRLEARLGLANVPYALLIAANLTYDIANLSWGDMFSLFWNNPRFNADWRLAALSALDVPAPVTLESLANAAKSQLNLAIPAELAE